MSAGDPTTQQSISWAWTERSPSRSPVRTHSGRPRKPTCRYAPEVVAALIGPRDATGFGDNFVAGIVDSLMHQMADQATANSWEKTRERESPGLITRRAACPHFRAGVYFDRAQSRDL